MTSPYTGSNDTWNQLGPTSDVAKQEQAAFDQMRSEFYSSMMKDLSGGQQSSVGMQADTLRQQAQQQGQNLSPAPNAVDYSDPDLIGAAVHWGMPEMQARSMPRAALTQWVQQQRAGARPLETTVGERIGAAADMLLAAPEMFGVGAAEAVTGLLHKIPFVGETVRKGGLIHDADVYFRSLEEGIRAGTPDSFQWVNTSDNVAGNLAATWYPAAGAWKLSAIATKAPILSKLAGTSAILRGAIQGGTSALLLEGGRDHSGSSSVAADEAKIFGGGALFGAGFEAAMPAVLKGGQILGAAAQKVSNAFPVMDLQYASGMSGLAEGLGSARGASPFPDLSPPSSRPSPAAVTQPSGVHEELLNVLSDPAASPEAKQSAAATLGQLGVPLPTEGAPAVYPKQPLAVPAQQEDGGWTVARFGSFTRLGPTGMTEAEATTNAIQMNKQAAIIQSPEFGPIAASGKIDDASVAQAMTSTNPGGSNVVQGVGDPAEFMARLSGGQPVSFANRGNRLDAIVGDVTPDQIAEYEKHGIYTGQHILMPNGVEGEVSRIGDGYVQAKPIGGGSPRIMNRAGATARLSSPSQTIAPDLYDAFKVYADQRTADAGAAMGGALSESQLYELRQRNMDLYMQDFFESIGVSDKSQQSKLLQYFNMRYLEEATSLIPPDVRVMQERAQEAVAQASFADHGTPLADLDEAAQTKGFQAVPIGEDGSVQLVDALGGGGDNPTILKFDSIESAKEAITNLDRELPDITPDTNIPMEIAAGIPRVSNLEPTLANSRMEDDLLASIDDAVDHETLTGTPFEISNATKAQARQIAATGNLGALQEFATSTINKWKPMRALAQQIDVKLSEAGMPEAQFFDDYDVLSSQRDKMHNWAYPWHDRWAQIMNRFKRADLYTGKVTQIYEMEDAAERVAAAQKAGFSADQIKALDDMHQFFRDIFPEAVSAGLDPARQVARYISHVKFRQSMPDLYSDPYAESKLSPLFDWFAQHVRQGNMQMRELDARKLGTIYINALGFQMHMADHWTPIIDKWNMVQTHLPELAPVADTFLSWSRLIRYGHDTSSDALLDALHKATNALIPGVTKEQVRRMFAEGLSLTHNAMLGFRLDVLARDSIQLFLAMPRVGTELLETLGRYANGNDAVKAEIWERGIKNGWVIMGRPRLAQPGNFEPGLVWDQAAEAAESAPSIVKRDWRYDLATKASDALHDFAPTWMKNMHNTPLSPLYFYTKQGERMRLIVGEAGYQRALSAITDFRAGGSADYAALKKNSAARTFALPVQEKFMRLIGAGQDEEAAAFLGRQLADATQFRYGVTESPAVGRSLTGKIGMQMGNFSFQYYQFLRESMQRNGRSLGAWAEDNAKLLGLLGGVTGALYSASKATGWNFNKWQYWGALTFTGGPWSSIALKTASGIQGVGQLIGTPGSQDALDRANGLMQVPGDMLGMLNPLGGVLRQLRGIRAASAGPDPATSLLRLGVTGEIGSGPEWNQFMSQAAPQGNIDSLQTQQFQQLMHGGTSYQLPPNPVRADSQTPANQGPPPLATALPGSPMPLQHSPVVVYPNDLVSSNPYNLGGYDIRSYATDPNHEAGVTNRYNLIKQIYGTTEPDAHQLQDYMNRVTGGRAPFTGQDIAAAAAKYGISTGVLAAILEQDSTFGMYGAALRSHNPGNVNTTGPDHVQFYPTWQAGIEAAAYNLVRRRIYDNGQSSALSYAAPMQQSHPGSGAL